MIRGWLLAVLFFIEKILLDFEVSIGIKEMPNSFLPKYSFYI